MTPRTCDELGVCQHRATPCDGCQSAPRTRACTANRCQQGRTPCPCPQACELPADPLQDERMTPAETVLAVLVATLLAVVLFAAFMAAVA